MPGLEPSILKTVKKNVQLPVDDTSFDLDILTSINTALATLTQLGVGPVEGVFVEDATTEWSVITDEDNQLNMVRSYVCLYVKSIFDPPTSGYAVTAMQKQIEMLEWRIQSTREERLVVDG